MINPDYFLTNVFLLAAGTLIIRGFFIALSGKIKISEKMRELFSFIPAAILPAFIFPTTFFHQGIVSFLGEKERFFVLFLSGLVFYFKRSTLLIIAFGLVSLYFLTLR
jgi:branched-subunit amino acid transport protein